MGTGELLVRVTSKPDAKPNFVAGLVYDTAQDRVIKAAPIIKRLVGLDAEKLRAVGKAKGWTLHIMKIGE
jgi:hypothetical protein